MLAPPTIMGRIVHAPVVRRPWLRRGIFIALIAICVVLTLFPQRYRAATSLTPTDPGSLGLSGALGQLGAVQGVFGSQAAVEVSLKIARSDYVRDIVDKQLGLSKRLAKSRLETARWLDRTVEIRGMRGGILQFELTLKDPALARDIVNAYANAVRAQLGVIARTQTASKREILIDLVGKASDRLARAQAAYDTFRLRTRYSSPQMAIAAVGDRIPQLEQMIKSKQVQLNAARQFFTDDNLQVRQIIAEIDALNVQLENAKSTAPDDPSSVGRVVRESTRADRLRRELDIAQSLYDSYKRFLQGTSVEDLASTANVRILEPAYIDTARQFNLRFAALGLLILLLALAIEFYSLRPPLGDRVPA